ncbi:unnamed protein product [Blumeria hordei]|uniref:Structural maintenance of chromosomes protein n=1 Tax=Blumeria hordei TaxID=2867405 RepID=A0A383UWM4_BLUHO|nr:unnamed protein product [Blumeria hordei]
MSELTTRSGRRAATRRNIIIESDMEEEEEVPKSSGEEMSEDNFIPAMKKKTSRKVPQTRRKTTNATIVTPKTDSRTRNITTKDNVNPIKLPKIENAENLCPESPRSQGLAQEIKIESPSISRQVSVPEISQSLPTPEPSMSPEPAKLNEKLYNNSPGFHIGLTKSKDLGERTQVSMETTFEKSPEIDLKPRSTATSTTEATTQKPRMVITYLILTNFKSYAGRQEVGPFHTSFSSVVGPNGSGKSNVIDSLLFVFGFRASKMRQGKISALIHNSAAHPNLEYCEVAVHFQEVVDQLNGSTTVIPNSNLVISRRAFKNNASKYFLDDKESNFTTVTTLLRERGIDLDHKRFLILQGEVESIAQMKPKAANEHDDGLLEYLEDIIGTSKYKIPIEESAVEVETFNEICIEKRGRVQHVEKEKNNLEDKKNIALSYIRDENSLSIKKSALYQVYTHECSNNLSVTEEAIAEMQAQLDVELGKHQGNEEEIKALKNQYDKNRKICEKIEKDVLEISKEMARLDQEHVKYAEKRRFLALKITKAEKTINDSKSAANIAESDITNCSAEIESASQKLTETEKQLIIDQNELTIIRESLKGKTQIFSDQIVVKQKSLEPWNEKINQKQSAIAVAESELAILNEKASAGSVAIEETETKIASIQKVCNEKAAELEKCKSERLELEKRAKNVQAELNNIIKNVPDLRSRLSSARQKADDARASLSNTQTQGNVLTGLMRLRESGRVDGFYGRLGNLGTIDKKYDVAISTACSALDHFVTDTVEAGQQCIEYLRKTNLGRGNFICLDKLRSANLARIETPENAPRLFDLITAKDEKFRAAFFYSLQNTLVVQDLAQANRIAYGAKRWRVVTLDGQLIDKSGTMSGGGNSVKKGLMSSKLIAETTKDLVLELESDRDSLEREFQTFQIRQRELEATSQNIQDRIPQLDTKMQKLDLEIDSCAKNLADSQRRIQELNRDHQSPQSDDGRVLSLKKDIITLNKEIKKLRGETSSVEMEIKLLQDKIMEVGGEKLRALKVKVDTVREEIGEIGEQISTAEVKRAKAEKYKVKHEKDQAKAVMDFESATTELEYLEIKIQSESSSVKGHQAEIDEAQKSLEVKKEELDCLKSNLDEKTEALNMIRASEIEMRNKLEENQKVLGENQKRFKYWKDKIEKLSLQNISDFGEESEFQDFPEYTKDELADIDKEALKSDIAALEEKTQNVNVDPGVLTEYRRRVEEYASRNSDLQSAIAQRDAAKKRCDEMRHLRLQGFMEGFSTISLRLKEMYQMITMGGNAELELVDSLDPFSEGILFSVMPPKKSWKNISNLSGGEKTLSSLALVFALHHYKPTPLYVMDEIDAALDFRNVSIVASYIKERTKNAQFIVISLRNNMFELATRLVGVYKVNHMTKSVTIENKDYINGAK